jgi:exodeoxyribonuclease III
MKIYSWNVNGLRAIVKKGFFDFMVKENPDILCLQETKIQDEQLGDELRNIDGYHSCFSFAERKGYSGVAVYSKHEPLSLKRGIGIERFDREGRILVVEYSDFFLLNIYFPNGKKNEERLNYKLDFYDAVLEYLKVLRKKRKNIIISGDYNTAHREIDLKNPEANENTSGFLPVERKWIDKLIEHGYIDSFRNFYSDKVKYSWWSYRTRARARDAGWRIDYHFVNKEFIERVKDADILVDVMGSDHCPVSIEIE